MPVAFDVVVRFFELFEILKHEVGSCNPSKSHIHLVISFNFLFNTIQFFATADEEASQSVPSPLIQADVRRSSDTQVGLLTDCFVVTKYPSICCFWCRCPHRIIYRFCPEVNYSYRTWVCSCMCFSSLSMKSFFLLMAVEEFMIPFNSSRGEGALCSKVSSHFTASFSSSCCWLVCYLSASNLSIVLTSRASYVNVIGTK